MAGEDDEVIVNLQGDTTSPQTVKIETEKGGATAVSFNDGEEAEDPVADLKKQFGQLTGRLQTVVASQQQTEHQLHEATQRLQRAESQVTVSQLETIENGIAQIDADTEAAYATLVELEETTSLRIDGVMTDWPRMSDVAMPPSGNMSVRQTSNCLA